MSDAPALEPARIESIGVTLADKKPGAFVLEVDSIRTYAPEPASIEPSAADTTVSSASAAAARVLSLAINRGAPLFNDGQPVACAAIYEIAIESIVALGPDDLGRGVIARLEQALAEAEDDHDVADRSWTYRRAMDDALGRLLEGAAVEPRNPSR